jgi:hypothetical protein
MTLDVEYNHALSVFYAQCLSSECHYAECHILIVMLGIVVLAIMAHLNGLFCKTF